jgi:hypothetical protein
MIVLHSVEDYALYPCIVISSPFGDWKTFMLPCRPSTITIPLVRGQEITTCHYKGLLQVEHLTLLGYSQYRSVATVSHRNGPSCTMRIAGGSSGTSPLNQVRHTP